MALFRCKGKKKPKLKYYTTVTHPFTDVYYDCSAAITGTRALFGLQYYHGTGKAISNVVVLNNSLTFESQVRALRSNKMYGAAGSVGGYALFTGGRLRENNTNYYYSDVDAFNSSLTRSAPESLSSNKNWQGIATIGNLLVIGGGSNNDYNGRYTTDTVETYNASLTHTTGYTPLKSKRCGLAATTIGNYVIFAGGIKQRGNASVSDLSSDVDVYDSSLTRLENSLELSVARAMLKACSTDSYALFAGGSLYEALINSFQCSNVVDAFDTSLTRSIPEPLTSAKVYHGGVSTDDFALFGGGTSDATYSNAVNTIDVYDNSLVHALPVTLSNSRYKLSAIKLYDNIIFSYGYPSVSSSYPYTEARKVDVYRVS